MHEQPFQQALFADDDFRRAAQRFDYLLETLQQE